MRLGIVVEAKQGVEATEDLQRLMTLIGVTVVPFDAEQAAAAIAAWRRFGKGRHPAGLNLGDCFSYALAKTSGAPLLHKGEDFSRPTSPARWADRRSGRSTSGAVCEHLDQGLGVRGREGDGHPHALPAVSGLDAATDADRVEDEAQVVSSDTRASLGVLAR